jgi:hypothetical protein
MRSLPFAAVRQCATDTVATTPIPQKHAAEARRAPEGGNGERSASTAPTFAAEKVVAIRIRSLGQRSYTVPSFVFFAIFPGSQ